MLDAHPRRKTRTAFPKREEESHIPSGSLPQRTNRNATTTLATSTDANGYDDFCGADGANLRKGWFRQGTTHAGPPKWLEVQEALRGMFV